MYRINISWYLSWASWRYLSLMNTPKSMHGDRNKPNIFIYVVWRYYLVSLITCTYLNNAFPRTKFYFSRRCSTHAWHVEYRLISVMFVIIRIQTLPFVMFTIFFAFLLNLQHNSLVLNFNSPLFKYKLSHCI